MALNSEKFDPCAKQNVGKKCPWTNVSLDDYLHEQMSSWTIVYWTNMKCHDYRIEIVILHFYVEP